MHRHGDAAVHFGRSGANRFDSPDGAYGVLYAADSPDACFIETLLREPGKDYVAEDEVRARRITEIEIRRDLTLARMHGPGLFRAGASAAAVTGDHAIAQQWSHAIHRHPAKLDGLSYRSARDNALVCYAMFDRAGRTSFRAAQFMTLTRHPALFARILDRYDVALG